MKRVLPIIFSTLLILSALLYIFKIRNYNNNTSDKNRFSGKVRIEDTLIPVLIADTEAEREKGLSGKESNELPANSGMLFKFESKVMPVFWMIDMKFPLDIIWITDGKVVYINKNVPNPEPGESPSSLKRYAPGYEVNYVLEVHAGFSDSHGIKVGDSFTLI